MKKFAAVTASVFGLVLCLCIASSSEAQGGCLGCANAVDAGDPGEPEGAVWCSSGHSAMCEIHGIEPNEYCIEGGACTAANLPIGLDGSVVATLANIGDAFRLALQNVSSITWDRETATAFFSRELIRGCGKVVLARNYSKERGAQLRSETDRLTI